jgi:hypothetical protein
MKETTEMEFLGSVADYVVRQRFLPFPDLSHSKMADVLISEVGVKKHLNNF